MARTPLLRRLQALFEDFEEAERSGRPLRAVQEERRKTRLTRRDCVKVTGAAVGAAAFSGPVAALAAGSIPCAAQGRIAIIGGGHAVLECALASQTPGYKIYVYAA